MAGLVRSASLASYAEVALRCGLDPLRMLREFRLPRRALQDREVRVPIDAVRRLLEASAERSGEDSFGLQMAEARQMSDLGPLGLLVREQPTVRLAVEACAHQSNRVNEALHLTIEEQGDIVVLREELLFGSHGPSRQATELAIGVIFRVLQYFLGRHWKPRRVCFMHAAPRNGATHERLFGSKVQFGQAFNGIVCSRRDLEVANPNADPGIAGMAMQLLEADSASDSDTTSQSRRLILRLLATGNCNIDAVAHHLGVDRRTVHRRLAREGTTYSALASDVKRELAARYLDDSRRSMLDTATLLGFSTPSGFSRWHRKQFGESATRRRDRIRLSRRNQARPRPPDGE